MAGFDELHVTVPLGGALRSLGWSADEAFVRECAPCSARGTSLIAETPAAACYAAPALAGALSAADAGGSTLLLCPAAALDEWAAVAGALAPAAGRSCCVAAGLARATRRLREGGVDLLVTTPETALTLVRRSALKLDSVHRLVLGWPELMDQDATLDALLQDLPKDSQRLVFTTRPDTSAGLGERFARRAAVVPLPLAPAPAITVRTLTVPWRARERAVQDLLEILDPASWCTWSVAAGIAGPGAGEASAEGRVLIALDLPTPVRLAELATHAAQVVLLAPAYAERYLARLVPGRKPLRLPGIQEAVQDQLAARRGAIARQLESGPAELAVLALAPLFERYEPAAVAAALYELWTSASQAGAAPAAPDVPAVARLWVGAGKKDGLTANDLVALLTKEVRVDRTAIGRIEIRDAYALVELPAQDVERIAGLVTGLTLRRRRLSARVDRGGKHVTGRAGPRRE